MTWKQAKKWGEWITSSVSCLCVAGDSEQLVAQTNFWLLLAVDYTAPNCEEVRLLFNFKFESVAVQTTNY